jgi:hypothetical protein
MFNFVTEIQEGFALIERKRKVGGPPGVGIIVVDIIVSSQIQVLNKSSVVSTFSSLKAPIGNQFLSGLEWWLECCHSYLSLNLYYFEEPRVVYTFLRKCCTYVVLLSNWMKKEVCINSIQKSGGLLSTTSSRSVTPPNETFIL